MIAVGDIVLCRVSGNRYLHLVKAIQGERFQIGNNRGGINGWITRRQIFGRLTALGTQQLRSRPLAAVPPWCMLHTMVQDTALELAWQSLRGLAIGDAFGETLFGEPERIAQRIEQRTLEPRRPWRWTDDTAMALSIVEVLGRHGRIDPDALAEAFARRWSEDPERGYGAGAFRLLTRIAYGAAWRSEAARLFGGQGSFGNGAAMRAAPIGAYFAGDLERVQAEALRSAEPTHAHPDGAAGAAAVAAAAALVATRTPATALLDEVARWTPAGITHERLRLAADTPLTANPSHVGAALGIGREVAAHDTVPFALWVAARHLDSYEEAIWTATSQPGDRDTLGAIVGGVVVLATGVDAIPPAWREASEPVPDPLA